MMRRGVMRLQRTLLPSLRSTGPAMSNFTLRIPAVRTGAPESKSMHRYFSGQVDLNQLRENKAKDVNALTETIHLNKFLDELKAGTCELPAGPSDFAQAGLTPEHVMDLITAGFTTFSLHCESRVASMLGQGFYTIGPCGEELLAAVGLALRETDAVCLHYRHLSTQIARNIKQGKSLDEILLDRARGYTVSSLDPVTGGHHCSLGGGPFDFINTSTLASQCTPAVGRALGASLSHRLVTQAKKTGGETFEPKFPRDMVSYVSLGDGSVNNAHFLSATNTAEYAQHSNFKCPVVFGITDNNLSISLRGKNWLSEKFIDKLKVHNAVFEANGDNVLDVYAKCKAAIEHSRKKKMASYFVVSNISRRFGHAATDRQAAYMSTDEIAALAATNPLQGLCAQAVAAGVTDYPTLYAKLSDIHQRTKAAFHIAATEPKLVSRPEQTQRMKSALVPYPTGEVPVSDKKSRKDVMRKHMTRVIEESLQKYPNLVYLGEDVEHGGYYLVTDGWDTKQPGTLAQKYPGRVLDFPPEETALIGAGIGFAQAGLLPIVEIPYAKYLDCGFDIFQEAGLSHWLSNGNSTNGMIFRLQGFGKGIFGGNFHTHNTIYTPPGMDVVCYSNGADYAKGMRYALHQASHGRVVMLVDCTHLLNLRHIGEKDDGWKTAYPPANEVLPFDDVTVYGEGDQVGIVTYGDGVLSALQAKAFFSSDSDDVAVIDCPYLSQPPASLAPILQRYRHVVFADICKEGQGPLSGHIATLKKQGALPQSWTFASATNAYNPLGTYITFLSSDDIIDSVMTLRATEQSTA